MFTLTIGRKFKDTFGTMSEAIDKFVSLRKEAMDNGESTDTFHKAKLKSGKETYRVSFNGRVWDKNDNEVTF